jgi:PAS domain S-box-containing protein
MFGYPSDEVGSQRSWWAERVHPDDLASMLARIEQALRSDATGWWGEYRFRRQDGSWAEVSTRGVVKRDANGQAVYEAGVMIDVTERTLAGKDVHRSQRLLRLVLDTLPVGVSVQDCDANIVMFNPASRRLWGDVIESALQRYDRSVGFWHASGGRLTKEDWGSQRALRRGETSLNELIDIESLDGRKRTMRNSAAPIRDEQQRIIGAVVVNEDVTERVRAEEEVARRERQQHALAQLTLSALKGSDVQSLLDESVSLLTQTLGVEFGAAFEWHGDAKRMELRAGARPRTDGGEPGVRNGIGVPVSGRIRPFGAIEVSTKVDRDFREDEVHFVWSIANVLATSIEQARATTEVREKREQLQSLSRKLIEAQEVERRAIARELHDDFGQVLTALRLNLQRSGRDDRDNIALVDGAIARMRDLAQDLRPPQLDELGLESSLRWYVEREAARAGLSLSLSIDTLPAAPAPAVAMTCFRVVQEALTNVLRHAHARRVSIVLRFVDNHLDMSVEDDGVGFDVAAARRRAARGESQGLLGMQERVELVGGEFAIQSGADGTRVRARLPPSTGGRQ